MTVNRYFMASNQAGSHRDDLPQRILDAIAPKEIATHSWFRSN